MRYTAKELYNPKSTTVEFLCGGKLFIFKPREHKMLDGFAAHHALKEVNTGLIPYETDSAHEIRKEEKEEKIKELDVKNYKDMSWHELLKVSGELGVYRVGAKRKDLERELAKLV